MFCCIYQLFKHLHEVAFFGAVYHMNAYRQVECSRFEFMREIWVASKTCGILFGGDDEFASTIHFSECLADIFDVFACEVVMVGVVGYLDLGIELSEIFYEPTRVVDA